MLAHVPGLRVVMPATVTDAHDLLVAAVEDPNPVVFVESRRLYAMKRRDRRGSAAARQGARRARRRRRDRRHLGPDAARVPEGRRGVASVVDRGDRPALAGPARHGDRARARPSAPAGCWSSTRRSRTSAPARRSPPARARSSTTCCASRSSGSARRRSRCRSTRTSSGRSCRPPPPSWRPRSAWSAKADPTPRRRGGESRTPGAWGLDQTRMGRRAGGRCRSMTAAVRARCPRGPSRASAANARRCRPMLSLVGAVIQTAIAVLYVRAAVRPSPRGNRWPLVAHAVLPRRPAAVLARRAGPVDQRDDVLWEHSAEHLVVMMAVAAAARPRRAAHAAAAQRLPARPQGDRRHPPRPGDEEGRAAPSPASA